MAETFRENDSRLAQDLKEWASRADEEYREVLSRHSVGDSIVFVGGVKPGERAVQSN